MTIFDKFKTIFSSGSDDAFGEKQTFEPKSPEKSPAQKAEEKQEQTNVFKISDILKNDKVKEIILDLYNTYTKESTTYFLKKLTSAVDTIKDLLNTPNLPETFKTDLTEAIINTFYKSNTGDVIGNLSTNLKIKTNPLLTLFEFLDTCAEEYQKYPDDMEAFFKGLSVDFKTFINDVVPIVQYFRGFKTQALTEISDKQKENVINLVNTFTQKYSKEIDDINDLFMDYKQTVRQRNEMHTSTIGGNGGF